MADKKQELAYARQLWRLNKEGRLVLVDAAGPISSVEADAAIKEGIALRSAGSGSEARAQ